MGTLKEKLLKDYDKKSFIIWIATISLKFPPNYSCEEKIYIKKQKQKTNKQKSINICMLATVT